ncbi:MAG TPA: hypothetical protein VNB68_03800 [Nitrososphaeraceae archaeon]|nr:hypothetical protein [Nitrososphaeraceae archaeon]
MNGIQINIFMTKLIQATSTSKPLRRIDLLRRLTYNKLMGMIGIVVHGKSTLKHP